MILVTYKRKVSYPEIISPPPPELTYDSPLQHLASTTIPKQLQKIPQNTNKKHGQNQKQKRTHMMPKTTHRKQNNHKNSSQPPKNSNNPTPNTKPQKQHQP
jgi:hypothetical protein